MSRPNNILIAGILSFVIISHLVFIYFIKYSNQNLSLTDFNLSGIGNLLNFIVTIVLISGLMISSLKKNSENQNSANILFTTVASIILAISYFSINAQMPFDNIYLFRQHGNRLLTGLMFILYLFTIFIFLSYVWLSIFNRRSFIFIRSILSSVLLIFGLTGFTFYYVTVSDPQIDNEQLKKNRHNVAVVLGAAVWSDNKPSPVLAARVDKALELLNSNFVNKIHFTGSNAPGEISEAEAAYKYAISKNADLKRLFIETETTSTNEQIHFIKRELLPNDDIDDVIIVSDKFHLVRIEEISRFNNIKIYAAQSDLKLGFETDIYNRLRESVGLIFFWIFAI